MIERTIELGMQPWVTTNAILLEERIGALHAAGLRQITVGYYGTGADYDAYVQRKNRYALDAGFAAVRDRYGMDVRLRINWLLMRPSCNLADLGRRADLQSGMALISRSISFITRCRTSPKALIACCSSAMKTGRPSRPWWRSWFVARRSTLSASVSRSPGYDRSRSGCCSVLQCGCRATVMKCFG